MNNIKYFILCMLINVQVFANDEIFYSTQQQLLKEETNFIVEDIKLEIDYLKEKVKDGTATKYDEFKINKLSKKLALIKNEKI